VTGGKTRATRPVRIVVADDEESARTGLATLLRDDGFEVTLAEDGLQALARVQESAPDVLVTDLQMPGLDGIEVLRRARESIPELIVVLVTAFADVETAVRAMHEGAEPLPDQAASDRRTPLGHRSRDRAAQAPRRDHRAAYAADRPFAVRKHHRFEPGDAGSLRCDRAGRPQQSERPYCGRAARAKISSPRRFTRIVRAPALRSSSFIAPRSQRRSSKANFSATREGHSRVRLRVARVASSRPTADALSR
jgi:CheY-like chemotaxis protein